LPDLHGTGKIAAVKLRYTLLAPVVLLLMLGAVKKDYSGCDREKDKDKVG